MKKRPLISVLIVALAISGSAVASPPASGAFVPGVAESEHEPDYKLGPFDKISVRVFGEDKLSADKIQIDASGLVSLPLIGAVVAGGRTAAELSNEIAEKLGDKYLQSPHVSVVIDEAVSQRVTVSGAVVESGVYTLRGRTTLNQAISMAKGPDMKLAKLTHVAIFRDVEGKSARAIFDLNAIREGKAPDPEIYGGDSIIVEGSNAKTFWHELIATLPALGVFAYF
jgi:polysaccharide export outer membrane protein